MRILFILFFINTFTVTSLAQHKKDTNLTIQATKFKKYPQIFDTVIQLSVSRYKMKGDFKLIAKKREKVKLIFSGLGLRKYYFSDLKAFRVPNLKRFIDSGLYDIPDESTLITNCRSTKDTIIDGRRIEQIVDVDGISDMPIFTIQYKFGKRSGKITYRSPQEALRICPQSKERNNFVIILKMIEAFFDKPETIFH